MRKPAAESGQHLGVAEALHLVHQKRDHIRRQAAPVAGREADHFRAGFAVMHQQARGAAARIAECARQCRQPAEEEIHRRIGIRCRPGRADGRAPSAARADPGIDADGIAIGRNRAGGADVEAAAAPGLPGARTGADQGIEADVEGLFEAALHRCRLPGGAGDGNRIAGIGAQIAIALAGGGEEGAIARQIEDDVALGNGAVARGLKAGCAAAGGIKRRIAIEADGEIAEAAGGLAQPAEGEIVARGRLGRGFVCAGDDACHGKLPRKAPSGIDRRFAPADHEAGAGGCDVEHLRKRRIKRGLRQKRGLFRPRAALFAPAGTITDIGRDEIRGAALLFGNLAGEAFEPLRFLSAGDEHRALARERPGGHIEIARAGHRAAFHLAGATGLSQKIGIRLHRARAIADDQCRYFRHVFPVSPAPYQTRRWCGLSTQL